MNKVITGWVAAMLLVSSTADAQVCDETDGVQQSLQYLRRLSFDLRGRAPTIDELNEVIATGQVTDAQIDDMLASDDFLQQTRRYHLDLLWSNISNLPLTNNTFRLVRDRRGIYYLPASQRRINYRGQNVQCLDEPARFDDDGNILTTPDANDPSVRREGWVEIQPYWDPSSVVRVCAFDAQAAAQAPGRNGTPVDCTRSSAAVGCGCGPQLRYCQSTADRTNQQITQAFAEQLLGYVDSIVQNDRPYSDLILGKDMPINGPIAFYLRYQTGGGGTNLLVSPDQNHPLPDLSFTADDNWQTVQRGERHAGVLTMPAFLLKFASNRGRANRFYQAFLCQEFLSSEIVPPTTDDCHQEPDLTKRCGCQGCHQAVEPAAAYWGRWAETGLLPLNEDQFPRYQAACATPQAGRNPLCRLFYFTAADVTAEVENEFVGQLRAFVFADSQREANIDTGPEGLAQAAVDTGAFARCSTERAWKLLLNRDPNTDEADQFANIVSAFETEGRSYRALVRAIVTSDSYARAGRYGEN
ncbi:MAG: hypothetical protein AAF449_04345 [Myxococcota bacterium]